MKKLSSIEMRNLWISFFVSKNHYYLPSSSLIPQDDDSLLWINSGVATLKKYFEGKDKPPSKRLVNIQKAIRTNDIDNVGKTSRHHTFFEMLGNFSIGDYFMKEAIEYAWEFLTDEKWLAIDSEKLYITVFNEDDATYKKWLACGVKADHIFKMSRETNFWDVGKGPCGPNTEIFYDRGSKYDQRGTELIANDIENDRFIEIWNIVFSQFNNDGKNNYSELPQKNIDTGAGFERLVAISQDAPSNFESDLFFPLIEYLQTFTKVKYKKDYYTKLDLSEEEFTTNYLFKSVVDFMRAITFAIADGAKPANVGRGYVLRKLLRRAVLNYRSLGIMQNVLPNLAQKIVQIMEQAYPNLSHQQAIIRDIVTEEEVLFLNTLKTGTKLFNKNYSQFLESEKILQSAFIFKLFETHGLPFEVIDQLVLKANLTYNQNEVDELLEQFKQQSKSAAKAANALEEQMTLFKDLPTTIFKGYEQNEMEATLIGLQGDDQILYLVFDETPFYATSGGQEHDTGLIANNYQILDVFKNTNGVIIHKVRLETPNHTFVLGKKYHLAIDVKRREGLKRNHSATHLLFSALENYTEIDLPQRGSKVEEDFFRFDFSYHKTLSEQDLLAVQTQVNKWIKEAHASNIFVTSQTKAKEYGAKFLDTVKYSDQVRVVEFEDICVDLCGGTHVKNTNEIEAIEIISFESRASGVFRLTAVSTNEIINKYRSEKTIVIINELQTKFANYLDQLKGYHFEELTQLFIENVNTFFEQVKTKLLHSSLIIFGTLRKQFENDLMKIFQSVFSQIVNHYATQILDSDESITEWKNLDKKLFGLIGKQVLTNPDRTRFLLNQNEEDANLIIICKPLEKNASASLNQFAKANNLIGGGSRSFFQFKGKREDVFKLINEVNQ